MCQGGDFTNHNGTGGTDPKIERYSIMTSIDIKLIDYSYAQGNQYTAQNSQMKTFRYGMTDPVNDSNF